MRFLYLVLLVAVTTGCVATYSAVGTFDRYNEVFVGKVKANLWVGGGTFTLTGVESGLSCTGNSVVVQTGLSCQGQWGEIFAECTDGRTITGKWRATSCKRGFGTGIDSLGSGFTFTFGENESEAIMKAKHKLQSRKDMPATPSYEK